MFASAFDVALERTADEVAGAKANGKRECEDDATEEDAERQLDNDTADLEVVEDHSGRENEYKPLDAEREETGILELCIDGSNQDRPCQKARD